MIFGICILGILLGSRFLGRVFDLHEISLKATALCFVFAFAETSIIRDFAYLLDKIDNDLRIYLKKKLKLKEATN